MVRPLRRWIGRLLTTAPRPPQPRRPFLPTLELLEERLTPSVTFASQVTFAVGANPQAVAVGDFNSDGRPDYAAANISDNTVSVLLNMTAAGADAPAFAAQVTFAVSAGPFSVAVGDFNGDGKPDLAVASKGADTVSVLLNTTATGATVPTFASQVTFAVGAEPESVAVGDFNGDGEPDLVVVNANAATVSVLLNTTAPEASVPSFAPQAAFAVGPFPRTAAVGDFNGDGKPDIAVTSQGHDTVSVLLNTIPTGATTPAFAPQVTFAAGSGSYYVATADFNGDGRPDLAVANDAAGTASVLLDTTAAGATAPTFAPQVTFAAGSLAYFVEASDFNGDGRPDLVVANAGDKTVSVLLNTTPAGASASTFTTQVTLAVGANTFSMATADLNGDGRPDLVVANYSSNTASVLLNTSTPFAVTTPIVVADQYGLGVVEYNRTTGAWVQLNPGNPSDVSLLAADAQGDVFVDYPGYGVFRYVPSVGVWTMVNGTDAVAIAVDAQCNLFASFAGAGVGEFRLDGSAQLLTPVAASLLAANANGDLAGDFPGYGVYRRSAFSGMWVNVNVTDAQALAIDGAGDVFASFAGAGTDEIRPDGGLRLLITAVATRLAADALGDVTGYVPGQGVVQYRPGVGVHVLFPDVVPASALATDNSGDVFADLSGYGVFEYDGYYGWRRLNAADVTRLAVA